MEEERYKAALERAKSAIKECGGNVGRIKMIESIFPELVENKDEKIREALIDHIYLISSINGIGKEDIIAWLEKVKDFDKQLEEAYKTADEVVYKKGYDEGYVEGMAFAKDELEKQGNPNTTKLIPFDFNAFDSVLQEASYYIPKGYIAEIKDDKVIIKKAEKAQLQKFKVGDWIITNDKNVHKDYSICKIVEIENNRYHLENGDYLDINTLEQYDYHLWSIADAKDGDVLAAHECYVIFKEIDGLNIKCHCTYHYMGLNPSFSINTLQNKTAFHPATKEECEQLFKKIEEEGFEWDATTKELSQKIVTKKSDKVWSEDDEKFFKENIIIELGNIDDVSPELYKKIIDWLDLIKKRLS